MTKPIHFTSFDEHCRILYEALYEQSGDTLYSQHERDIKASYALISHLYTEQGKKFVLIQIDGITAKVGSWEEIQIQNAIEEIRNKTNIKPDILLKCLQIPYAYRESEVPVAVH